MKKSVLLFLTCSTLYFAACKKLLTPDTQDLRCGTTLYQPWMDTITAAGFAGNYRLTKIDRGLSNGNELTTQQFSDTLYFNADGTGSINNTTCFNWLLKRRPKNFPFIILHDVSNHYDCLNDLSVSSSTDSLVTIYYPSINTKSELLTQAAVLNCTVFTFAKICLEKY